MILWRHWRRRRQCDANTVEMLLLRMLLQLRIARFVTFATIGGY